MQATAIAQPNIALVKYWGKRDLALNLPAVGSISITLDSLHTKVGVSLDDDLAADELSINGEASDVMLPRISACLDRVLGECRSRASIVSHHNFPIAAGLASSASAFAATTLAAASAGGRSLSQTELARLAGSSSGSAARSLFGGFAELRNSGESIEVSSLCDVDEWPLQVVIAITETGAKKTGSTEAMEISRKTSPFYESWVERQEHDLDVARQAILERDFPRLAAIAEHNCLKMHSVMWASRPPMVFWNAATMRCLQTVRRLQGEGADVFFTIDAGPQVKAVCAAAVVDDVERELAATPGVQKIMVSGLGPAARLIES